MTHALFNMTVNRSPVVASCGGSGSELADSLTGDELRLVRGDAARALLPGLAARGM